MPRLLRPLWLAGHVLVVVAALVMVRLGSWQWSRAEELEAFRNYTYAVEWWAFALLTVVGWVKLSHDELVPDPEAGILSGAVVDPVQASALARADQWDDDPEVAAWNARFAELHLKHALKERSPSEPRGSRRLGGPDRKALG